MEGEQHTQPSQEDASASTDEIISSVGDPQQRAPARKDDWKTCMLYWRGKDPHKDWELGWKSEEDEERDREEREKDEEERKEADVKEPDPRIDVNDMSRGKRHFSWAIGFRWAGVTPDKDWNWCLSYTPTKKPTDNKDNNDDDL